MTQCINLKNNYQKEKLHDAALEIKKGNLVIFPTETVYGIGADGLNEEAVKKIFIAKGRPQDNPLILHVSSIDMIKKVAKNITDLEYKLINGFFPGPLTLILKKKDNVPYVVSAGLDTVGVRMPKNKVASDLIELAGTPIAAPSANISGKPSGTSVEDIFDEFNNKVSFILDAGKTNIGVESTVVQVIDNIIHILRPGKVTYEQLSKYAEVILDPSILNGIKKEDKAISPGMKYRHYAPTTKCVLVYSDNKEKLISKMQELENDNNSLVITKDDNLKYFNNAISYGNTLEEISHNIFSILRKADKSKKSLIIIEGVNPSGLGLAIMNRLIRACSYNYIKI